MDKEGHAKQTSNSVRIVLTMRVLWFSITPANYANYASNGGGWIESLQRVVSNNPQLELGIAFVTPLENSDYGLNKDGVTYYPLYIKRNWIQKWYDKYTYKKIDELTIEKCLAVVRDFKPDVIHVFGSEWCFGLITEKVQVPVVIHMQGCWPASNNMNLLLKNSLWHIFKQRIFRPRRFINYMLNEHISKERVLREERILSNNHYFMGRTRWDRSIVELYSPHARYYFCSEALRNAFIESKEVWKYRERKKKVFVTTGIAVDLKGYDVVLRVAYLLKKWSDVDFEWRLMGPTPFQMKIYEQKTGIKCKSVNVVPCGNKSQSDVLIMLINADCYIHPSYIDNSPNAVCEAQYLGLPVIATKVGGTPSLFSEDYNSRLLVGSNDPHDMASAIKWLLADPDRMRNASVSNYSIARKRHNDVSIGKDLLSVYDSVIREKEYGSI